MQFELKIYESFFAFNIHKHVFYKNNARKIIIKIENKKIFENKKGTKHERIFIIL